MARLSFLPWLLLLPAAAVQAADPHLTVEPAAVVLRGPWDRQQLLLTGSDAQGRVRDLTRQAEYRLGQPEVAAVTATGVLRPLRAGQTVLLVRQGRDTVRVLVRIEQMEGPAPVSFAHQVLPVLTRAGCNSGACHGTPSGKNGFRLSLRGYLPSLDAATLVREAQARRIDCLDPEASLLLRKAAGRVPHEGGCRLAVSGTGYALLRAWIGQGASVDAGTAPALVRLEVQPAFRILDEPAVSQQMRVLARFADGSERDVTHLARYTTNAPEQATVTADGWVERRQPGEVAVTVEYLGRMTTARLLFRAGRPDFVWPSPPEHGFIDHQVFTKLRTLQIEPAPLCGDGDFIRRIYLDVLGKLPTPDQTRRFLAERSPDKRERLIDAVLQRPEFASWWAMKWSDRLGCNQRFVGKIGAHKYHAWIRAAMLDNVPEDVFVREILTARGGNYSHPAAGFFRRLRTPPDRAEEVAQLFLGVRLQCARCHNHPGERWTQDDYYGMAAFFARIRYRDGPFFLHLYDKEETVHDARNGEVTHPRTRQVVPPRFLGGAVPPLAPGADRREALARWLTSPDNPYFARAAVNRIWYHLFGRGIVDPVDDFRGSNPPSNEALLDALAADFVRCGFDRKHLIRTILCSRTYQLAAQPADGDDGRYFSHARVRLLQAEQLLDALRAATGAEEKFPGFPAGTSAVDLPDGELRHPFLEAFGRPARALACECERGTETSLRQALHLVGGRTVSALVCSEGGRIPRLLAAGKSNADILDELYLAALCRLPDAEERRLLLAKVPADGPGRRRVLEDVLWALLNHREFLFQH
jgi:hypothetical protein